MCTGAHGVGVQHRSIWPFGGRYRGGGGGGLGTCDIWNGDIWCGEDLTILYYRRKMWCPDRGTTRSTDRERWLLFRTGLWVVAAVSWRRPDGCLDGGSSFLEASGCFVVGHKGNVHAKSAKNDTQKPASDLQIPRHNLAHFCCAQCWASTVLLFLLLPLPGFGGG